MPRTPAPKPPQSLVRLRERAAALRVKLRAAEEKFAAKLCAHEARHAPKAPRVSGRAGARAVVRADRAAASRGAIDCPMAATTAAGNSLLFAFDQIDAASGLNNHVLIRELREAVPRMPRAAFDSEIDALRKARIVTLETSDGRHRRLPPEDLAAAIVEFGKPMVYIARRAS